MVITSDPGSNGSSLLGFWGDNETLVAVDPKKDAEIPYDWTCTYQGMPVKKFQSGECPYQFKPFTVQGHPVDPCLSKLVNESCKLQLSRTIMIIVISCNLVKALYMSLSIWKLSETQLVTLGDAIASFLETPDKYTINNCLAGQSRFPENDKDCYDVETSSIDQPLSCTNNGLLDDNGAGWDKIVTTWKPERFHWFRAASKPYWLICVSL